MRPSFRSLRFFVLCLFLIAATLSLTAQSGSGAGSSDADDDPEDFGGIGKKNKIVVVVLDVSTSIKPYFQAIQNVVSSSVIERLIEEGDYLTLISFSDSAIREDGARILRDEDKAVRTRILRKLRPDGQATDIGAALESAIREISMLRGEQYDEYEPIVLFITDGEHKPMDSSRFKGMNVEQIFQDPVIGGDIGNTYAGWYFVGIGENLKDIRRIAELAGRQAQFLQIKDTAGLEKALDAWVGGIEPVPVFLEPEAPAPTTTTTTLPPVWKRPAFIIPVLAVVVLLIAGALFVVLKASAPIPVVMEIVGATSVKAPPAVSMKIGEKKEFGMRVNLPFRLVGDFKPVAGSLKRIRSSKWEIVVDDQTSPYHLNDELKIKDLRGNPKSIRFVRKG